MFFVCKYCGKEFNKKPSSKAKYCCKKCMYADPDYKKALSNGAKIGINANIEKHKIKMQQMVEAAKLAKIKKYGKYKDRLIKTKNGQILDITNGQLEEYRKTHIVCEICGKTEKISHNHKTISKLAVDHDHKTSKFRGLLCCDCNRKLGWFENLEKEIIEYLHKK